uniref:Putative nucleolar protein n=1 Tax=Amblyomma triste TaxID=251400 RepID=A0A023G870_AMBTT
MAKRRKSTKAATSAKEPDENGTVDDGEACTPSSPSQEVVTEGKEVHDLDANTVNNVNAPKESLINEDVAKAKKPQYSISDIKKDASLIIADKSNSNLLIDIIDCLSSKSDDVVIAGVQAANKVFCHFLKTSAALYESSNLAGKPTDSESPLEKYHSWLRDRYADAWRHIVAMLSGKSSSRRQSLALQVAMKWIELETVHRKQGEHHVPINKLATVVEVLLDAEHDMKSVISKFSQYVGLADVKTYTLKALGRIARTWRVNQLNTQEPAETRADGEEPTQPKKPELTDRYLTNVYHMLLSFDMAAEPPNAGEPIAVLGGESTRYVIDREQEVKRLSTVWITFLRQKLPVRLYRELLIMLPEKVVPYLHNPLLVTDFFIESYNRGGSHSLMALNGLFVLIHRFHLDYPNFYEKLYALLEPSVFYEKYRARFFFLTDVFLSSTHLPAYLVASFAKTLARMALSAPPYALLYIIPFIGNLLIRHRSLITMINDPSNQDASVDPFDAEQANPSKSQAADSSLWELKTLQSHWHPTIAKKAKFIDDNLPRMEWDFSERLEGGYAEMMKRAKAAKHKEAPTNFHKVEGLLNQKEELLSELWTLE